jgi:transmembrane sensor
MSGIEPRVPLRQYLDLEVDEEQVPRMWKRIQRGSRRSPTVGRVAAAVALAAAVLLVVVGGWPRQAPDDAGALAATSGALPRQWSVPAGAEQQVNLTDGSQIELASDTRLEVLTNTGSVFVTSLKRGRGAFEVEPGGPRQWVVDCGFVTVEVVGTRFVVDRSDQAVEVVVQRGKVQLRGEGVDRVLSAGETVTVSAPRAGATEPPAPEDAASASGSDEAPPDESSEEPTGDSARGAPAATPVDYWDRLLGQADAARRRGDRVQALALLERVAKDCPDGSRRKLAGFTLARLQLDDDPKQAARTLDRVLEDGVTRGLNEGALARLVEAHARAGDQAAARRVATEYEKRYPQGRYLAEVRHWATQE